MKKSTTKRALFLSFVSMFLCFTMLLGTTYAWFTDSVTSGLNTIVAGNLDVELYHSDKAITDEKVTETTKLFDDVDSNKWEPGAMVWEKLTVKNEGNLALKYQLTFNVANATVVNVDNKDYSFADMLKVAILEEPVSGFDRAYVKTQIAEDQWSSLATRSVGGTLTANDPSDTTDDAASFKEYIVVIYWKPSDIDNYFNMNNGKTVGSVSVDLGVNLFATQVESEFDSFDNKYDEDAADKITVKETVDPTKPTLFTAPVAPSTTNAVTTIEAPAGAFASDVASVGATVTPTSSLFDVSANGAVVGSIDVDLVAYDANGEVISNFDNQLSGGAYYVVTTYIAKGLSNVTVSYEGTTLDADKVTYDAATGKLVFKTTHFSQYDVSGAALAYDIEKDIAYATVEDVVAAIVEAAESESALDSIEIVADVDASIAKDISDGISDVVEEETFEEIRNNLGSVKIGENSYFYLQEAVDAAQNGETIVLSADITNKDGVLIQNKNLTVDLNGYTFTVSEGASTNNRNFKINGTSNVTIKNGTMIAAGDYGSGAYGTVRTEDSAVVTLTDLKLYNYRGNGLNIKACDGTTVYLSNTEIYSQYGGGIEAAGATITVDNVKVEQKGMYTAPYNSMAISVNGGGTVTVNSGTFSTECLAASDANNQGSSHGPWVIGVLNSGGTLIVNGGTFSNDNYGDNSLATAARGAILADTGANVIVNGGQFNALAKVVDIQNNLGDASKNPVVTLKGGTFSADPTTNNISNCIVLAEGCEAFEKDGVWIVGKSVSTADELKAAITNAKDGDVIVIASDITVTDKWDNRYGGKTNKAITINGLDNTLKFTGAVNDGLNYHAVFRFEGDATVKNLTFDFSEAEAGTYLRAISATSDLIVDNCTFIGSDNYTKDNAVMFGDTNASSQIDASVSITNCAFTNWRRGVSDNENAKEVKSVVISGNNFEGANAYISVYSDVTFTDNVMDGSLVNITSYTNAANVKVVVIDNVLDSNVINVIGSASKMFGIANVTAQEGIIVNAN